MSISDKNRTNRKWVSTDKYKNNYDKIFSREGVNGSSDKAGDDDTAEKGGERDE